MSSSNDGKEPNKSGAKVQHRNDMYGQIDARSEEEEGVQAPIPAATVILLRQVADDPNGVEVLMLRKNSKITFGGMWVFPGGKLDAGDHDQTGNLQAAAANAAARETEEEAGIQLEQNNFIWFAHWTPPPGPQKRFATWFFVARLESDAAVTIDDGEIKEHAWISPTAALEKHAQGEIDLVPPTWITLYQLSLYSSVDALIAHFSQQEPKIFATRVVKNGAGDRVAMWHGDSGYEDWDAEVAGARHRLVMAKSGFTFENTAEVY